MWRVSYRGASEGHGPRSSLILFLVPSNTIIKLSQQAGVGGGRQPPWADYRLGYVAPHKRRAMYTIHEADQVTINSLSDLKSPRSSDLLELNPLQLLE